MFYVHSFPLSHYSLKNILIFMELQGGVQQQCPLMLPSSLGDAMPREFTCSKASVPEHREVLLEGCSLGV